VAIVFSILLAFAIQAWWDNAQLRRTEAQFLRSLTDEFRGNRDDLARITNLQVERREGLQTLIREAGSGREGLSQDSLHTLLVATAVNPVFFAVTDVLEGGGLEVLSDPYLRRRVAGFWRRYENYFNNQQLYVDVRLSPEVVLGTGTGAMIEFDVLGPLADSVVWSQPLTADQMNFLKFLGVSHFISGLGIDQGTEILTALDSLILDLEGAVAH